MANDVLFGFANNPGVRPEDRRIYQAIANSASSDPEELAAENEQMDRARFEVITSGVA